MTSYTAYKSTSMCKKYRYCGHQKMYHSIAQEFPDMSARQKALAGLVWLGL